MKNARHIALILFFIGLAALEIAHGLFRLNAIRERQRLELRERIERDHLDLAGGLRDLLAEKRDHAAFLARAPAVSALVATPRHAAARGALESLLLPYLVSFRSIDSVRILDAHGGELFRCERIGGAAGALPESLLAAEPDSGILELVRGLSPGDVAVSPLSIDRGRVEVPECDRQVLHYASRVDGEEERGGIVVLTVYAHPLLEGLRRFSPLEGVDAVLVDAKGSYVSDADPSSPLSREGRLPLFVEHGPAASRLLSGDGRAEVDGVAYMGLEVHRQPSWLLLCRIPERALDEASRDLRGEHAWIIGSTVTLTAAIAVVAAILVRLSVRELRLRERDRYLELERRLRISERLGSLGLLTAGVAHEINNPLEAIGNYLSLLDRERVPEEKRRRYLGLVRHGFDRIRDIVRDLASFTRPEAHGGIADIAQVVRRSLVMARYSRRFHGSEVELSGLEKPVQVTGEAGRLEQVFINLLLNAARAAGDGGRIRIDARRIHGEADAADASGPSGPAGSLVEVRVEDNGPGIAEEDLGRIFDPFFTRTSPEVDRSALGLGLFISYGIIDAHGGTLWAENRAEGGARFVIRLPAAGAALEDGTARRETSEPEPMDNIEPRGD